MRLFGKARQEASVNDVMPSPAAPIQPNDPSVGNLAGKMAVKMPVNEVTDTAGFVTRVPRQNLTHMYSYGATRRGMPGFSTSVAPVSSEFQPYNSDLVVADFNHGLHEGACWPTMTGISFKVAHVPSELLAGEVGATMQAQPQQRRSIFTNRNYSVAPSLPAKPTSS